MKSSLAAVFHGSDQRLELRRIPLPELQVGETLVRVLGCTICGSDLHTFDGRRSTPTPTILGHEIVGEISAFGAGAAPLDATGATLQLGDRVTWAIVASCGGCFYCQRDLPQKCAQGVKYGHQAFSPGRELLGGLAEHCLLPVGAAVIRLPDSIPLSVACPASCATATVAAAVGAAGVVANRRVAVFGLGLLGLTACAMTSDLGADIVVGVDVEPARLKLAGRFGATHQVTPEGLESLANELTAGHGFDIVVEMSGVPAAVESGFRRVRVGGSLVLVGSVFPTKPIALAPEHVVRRNLTIHGIHNYGPQDLVRAVDFLAQRHADYPFDSLVKDWFPLEQAAAAFQKSQGADCIRVGVRPTGLSN